MLSTQLSDNLSIWEVLSGIDCAREWLLCMFAPPLYSYFLELTEDRIVAPTADSEVFATPDSTEATGADSRDTGTKEVDLGDTNTVAGFVHTTDSEAETLGS